jgi:hypothetical protein
MCWCFIRIRIPKLDPYLPGAFIFMRIGISLCVLAGLWRCHFTFLLFLDGSKKTLHDILTFNNNSPQTNHIYKKYKPKEKKNKTKCEGPTNKPTKVPNIFWNFLLSKRDSFGQISNSNGHKNYGQGIRVCFAKNTLSKHTFGPTRPKTQTRPTPFFLGGGW